MPQSIELASKTRQLFSDRVPELLTVYFPTFVDYAMITHPTERLPRDVQVELLQGGGCLLGGLSHVDQVEQHDLLG